LSSLLESGPVLLCFYTNDFSPDCIREWCAFRDFGWFAGNPALQVVGASRSGTATHRRFIDYLDLPFPLVADTALSLADAFGVSYRAFGLSSRSRRSCFLVDETLEVRYRWLGEHWLDPTRSTPPTDKIHEDLKAILGPPADEFADAAAPAV
jgi:peroxiredoxin Q/BCP